MRFDVKQLKEMSNCVRSNALNAVRSAASGHVGIILSAADIITTIYANFLRPYHDKFILSSGHGSALLYSVLRLAGYDVGDLNSFRKIGGLPGHPEFGIDGVYATTGPLGQGVGNAVGMAIGAKIQKSDEMVYCLCGDGDLMEGVANEAITFAGRYKLNNLVLLWDDNKISIDGVALTDVNVPARMRAAGWNIIRVRGDDFNGLNRALHRATMSTAPTFIQCRDVIGRGASVAGTAAAHGLAISDDELGELVKKYSSDIGVELWNIVAKEKTGKCIKNQLDIDVKQMPELEYMHDISTRELSGMYLQMLFSAGINLIGGSADLSASTNVKTSAHHDITSDDFDGNFINYGVREHAMGAIMNGMAAAGLRPYGSTFLVFSDYLRPSIRLSAMSGLPVIYVFTHDSIAVGQDGPTHQPIEQLPSLRLIPHLNVYRPCNGAEVAYAWRAAIADTKCPSCLVLSRQKINQIPTPPSADLSRGAYVILPATSNNVRATIIATGAEVPLAVRVAKIVGNDVQVVSMPCVSTFRLQDCEYRKKILRGYIVVIEAAATAPWFEFADAVVGIDRFGISGPGDAVYSHFGFDADTIARDIAKNLK